MNLNEAIKDAKQYALKNNIKPLFFGANQNLKYIDFEGKSEENAYAIFSEQSLSGWEISEQGEAAQLIFDTEQY